MSFTIENAHIQAFASTVFLEAQQRMSRFAPHCTVETGVVGESKSYDRNVGSEMVEITDRHGDTPFTPTEHSRRRLFLRDYDWNELVDDIDKLKTIVTPENTYTKQGASAAGRRIDDTVIAALDGTADTYTKAGGGGTQGFAAGQIVPVDYIEDGSAVNSNMTVAKLREARRLFLTNEVPEFEPLTMAMSGSNLMALMRDDEVTSSDYSTLNALMRGDIVGANFMGFHMVHTERQTLTGNNRHCLAWSRRGCQLSFAKGPSGDINKRPDKRNNTQVYFSMSLGSVRMDELEVVRILADETA